MPCAPAPPLSPQTLHCQSGRLPGGDPQRAVTTGVDSANRKAMKVTCFCIICVCWTSPQKCSLMWDYGGIMTYLYILSPTQHMLDSDSVRQELRRTDAGCLGNHIKRKPMYALKYDIRVCVASSILRNHCFDVHLTSFGRIRNAFAFSTLCSPQPDAFGPVSARMCSLLFAYIAVQSFIAAWQSKQPCIFATPSYAWRVALAAERV